MITFDRFKYHFKCFPAIFLFLLVFFTAKSQQPYFKEIATNRDMGGYQINCIYQDQLGFIWLGTSGGVFRFDGSDFNEIELPDSLSDKNVSAIYEDEKGLLWFGFESGIILQYDKFSLFVYNPKGFSSSSKIQEIIKGPDQSLWIGTYGNGLFHFQNGTHTSLNLNSGLSDNYIYSMIQDKLGNIWSGTDNGINISSLDNGKVSIQQLSVEDGLPDFIVTALAEDKEGNIWIGMFDQGFCYYDSQKKEFISPLKPGSWKYGPVNDLIVVEDEIWISTDGHGIVICNADEQQMEVYENSNNVNLSRIHSMLYDREGNVWLISSHSIQLSLGLKIEYLNNVDNYPLTNIHALIADSEDNIWFVNDVGLHKYNPNEPDKENQLRLFLLDIDPDKFKVMSLYRDVFGLIWAGTFGKGILRFDPDTGDQIILDEKDGLVNGNVLSIKGSESEIWFATLGGVSKCSIDGRMADIKYKPDFKNYSNDDGLVNNYIYNLFIDSTNRVWLATDGSGVCYFEENRFVNILNDSAFNEKVIYSIAVDERKNVWMNAAREGLFKYDGESVLHFTSDKEHKNLSFTGIIANNNDELVIAYNEGIDVLNTFTRDIHHFESNAGIENIDPDLNTLTMDSKGRVWVGTTKGIIVYSPSDEDLWCRPQPRITDVNLFLQKIEHKKDSVFKHNENHLSFNYSGLWYQYPEKVEFQIRLKGHDLDWINTRNKSVIYSNLSPGKYRFEVKVGLYENYSNSITASYSFEVRQPFWMSFWFYLILAIVLAALIYFYIKMREKRLSKKQEALRERIRFQFENLKSQINPHFLFNSFSTLVALIDQDKDIAIEYVEELSDLFRNVLAYRDLDVISLSEELDIIDNYYKIQKKRYGKNLELKISEIQNKEEIKIPPLSLQLLVENAIKHNVVSKEQPLQIQIYADDKKGYLYVENILQEKKETEHSTGIGIRNIIQRYDLLTEKKIDVIKTETSFKIGLPYII